MFEALPNYWLPACFSHTLKKKPLRLFLANEALVLFRGNGGTCHALLDQCPHRGVNLSLGKVTKDGCIECPFHGWQFDGAGECRQVPFNPDAKKHLLGTVGFPTFESHGVIWVYTGLSPSADTPQPIIPNNLVEARWVEYQESSWACHWTRAMENMLDIPHLPYIHKSTIGRGLPSPEEHPNIGLEFELTQLPDGFSLGTEYSNGYRTDSFLSWQQPCIMRLKVSSEFELINLCVPAAENQTRMMIVSTFKGNWFKWPMAKVMTLFNRVILAQDQRVIESSYPIEIPWDTTTEKSVGTDRPTLLFRQWYRTLRSVSPRP